MDNDELVPTSDPEELEEIQADSPFYWVERQNLPPRRDIANPHADIREGSPECMHVPTDTTAEVLSSSRVARVPGSPWKRRKLSHPLELLAEYGSPPSKQSIPTRSANVTCSPKHTVALIGLVRSPADMRSSSPVSSSLLHTPIVESDDEDPLITAGYDYEHTGVQKQAGVPYSVSPASERVPSHRAHRAVKYLSPTLANAPFPMARSPSMDPLALFSHQSRSPPFPCDRPADSRGFPSPSPSPSPLSSPKASRSSRQSSPLTPVPSPTRRGVIAQRGSALDVDGAAAGPPSGQPAVEDMSQEELAAIVAEQAQGRYSLRTRLARQKNPYAYDKALYKRQMRSNPDAIVKVISPHRHGKHRSRSEVRPSDEEFSGLEEEPHADDIMRRRRRKARSRSIGPERAPASEAEAGDEESLLKPRSQQRRTLSKRSTAPSRETHSTSNAKDPSPGPVWQPSVFNETFSSSEESVILDVADDVKAKESTKNRRKRARPFPMKKKDVVRRSPTPEQGNAEITTRRIEPLTADDITEDNPEVHQDEPAPRWRRRKSSASLPLKTPPSSPLMDNTGLDHIEDQPWAVDHNIFHDSGSPVPPSSSVPIEVDLSSPRDLAAPKIHQQAEVSDSDVVLVSEGHRSSPGRSSDDTGDHSSADDDLSADQMTARDRRRFKALQRMMPGVMIHKYQQNNQKPKPRRTASLLDSSDGESENEDQPLRPGQTRVIRRTVSERENFDIHGDPESSDVGMIESRNSPSASSSESDMDKVTVRRPQHSGRVVGVSTQRSTSIEEDTDNDLDKEIGQWVFDEPSKRGGRSINGAVLERDLIDRMLSHTRPSGRKKRKKDNVRRALPRSGTTASSNAIRVVISGGKRTGPGRQTVLAFDRAPKSRSSSLVPDERDQRHVPIGDGTSKTPVTRKRKAPRNQGTLFMFAGEGGHLVSGRTHKAHVTIDAEQATTSPASVLRPANRDYTSLRESKPRSRGANVAAVKERTLQDYWDEDPELVDLHSRAFREVDGINGIPSRRVTLDFGVPFLSAGMSFGADCYLGRGCLHELIGLVTSEHNVHCPAPFHYLNFDLRPTMSAQDFELTIEKTCQHIRSIFSQRDLPSAEGSRTWQIFFHSAAQHLSWLLSRVEAEEYVALCASLRRQLAHLHDVVDEPMEILPEDDGPNILELEIRWFILEAETRIETHRAQRYGNVEGSTMKLHVKRLLARLWATGFQCLLIPFMDGAPDYPHAVDIPFTKRVGELWVCIIHYVDAWARTNDPKIDESNRLVSLWQIIDELVAHEGLMRNAESEVASSEMLWHCIFTLCSLSQFSVHGTSLSTPRIPASWGFVASALDRVKLQADAVLEALLSKRSLHKRDEYIRILVARCLVLTRKWKWPLDDATVLFNRLLDIFKSRRFANLSDEFPDFPSFLRHSNIELLADNKRSDTAFTLFLKLVVKAADDTCPPNRDLGVQGTSQKVKKLLSLCVPLGSVPFTKTTPPNRQQLSMLYNRFSAVAVAIFLEPSLRNIAYRLANARRYVNFKDADDETRRACIRGLMHLAILLRHLHLPLEDIWDWLGHMSNILVDEYVQKRGDRRVAVGIQMLLGCVRRVIETPLMVPGQSAAEYPDPAWLKGPWIKRIFSLDTQLSANVITGMEIRKLVQSFLDTRAAALPPPKCLRPLAETAEDSQESQEYFGAEDMNWDDPELVAALDPENSAKAQQLKQKDEAVCEIIAQDIVETIYRLVMRHFSGPNDSETLEQYSDETDRWVDCWVGCASVLVQNGKRDWSWYLTLGPQSWEKISDDSWRRRVGLRFMLMVLRLDPSAYFAYQFQFIDVLMQAFVAAKVTIEHEYMALLCSIDGLRHPLLDDMPCQPDPESADYKITKKDFADKRLSFIRKVIANLVRRCLVNAGQDPKAVALREKCVGSVLTMLSTMQNIHQSLPAESEERVKYTSFSQQVYGHLSTFPSLRTNARLAPLVQWAGIL